jgi:NAD(P)H-hydrate epimerase
MKVSRVEEMRDLDRRATEEYGISQEILMENAGDASYFVILTELGVRGMKFAVFGGTGNNGGDGFVVARKLHSMGGDVKVFMLDDSSNLSGPAKANFEILSRMPVEIQKIESIESIRRDVLHCDAIVDAIFGTGLTRAPSGLYEAAIELINDSGRIVFSLDIPSGVNGDSGAVEGVAVQSDFTITYGLPKIGNMLYPGFGLCGKLYVSHISFPTSLQKADSIKVHVNRLIGLPERDMDAHKGSCGKALFIAGSASYLGAPYFAAISFLKAGGGLSYLATPKSIAPFLAAKGSEVVFVPQSDTDSGSLSLSCLEVLLEFSSGVDMVVLGPGLSLNTETQELVRELAQKIEVPLLVDGDGITALTADVGLVKTRKAPTILTPHSGEMARIAGKDITEVNAYRINVLQDIAGSLNAIIVLKGAHSLIGYPDGTVYINTSGNPGMATAGSGDALTGTIAAMYGLGLSVDEAVRMGVFIHGLSGDIAADEKGEDGITAQDIVDYLPDAMKSCREEFDDISENFYETIYTV